jgi:hypothetical protein
MKLEATGGYETATETNNCHWLLTNLKNICHSFEHTENRWVALVNAKAAILNYTQGEGQHPTEYYEQFKTLVTVLESYGGKLHDPEGAAPPDLDLTVVGNAAARDLFMRERYLGVMLIRNADSIRFDSLKTDLANDFAKGRDEYPRTLVDAHQLLLTYQPKKPPKPRYNGRGGGQGGGQGDGGRGGGGRGEGEQEGRSPGRWGGRNRGRGGVGYVPVAFNLTQTENSFPHGIPDHFILLDSDSTVSIFRNPDLLTNIRNVTKPLYLETNGGGQQTTYQMGTIANFGEVWFNPDSIANVLSLAQVRKVRRVTMDTAQQPAFHVHALDGTGTMTFHEHESGLYLYDASTQQPTNADSPLVIDYSCLQTVAANKENFTKRQIEQADEARKLYRMLGRPSMPRFLHALTANHIINCPVTADDAKRAELIYGKDVAFIKGKTTASPPKDHVPEAQLVSLPSELLSANEDVTLCFDIFYVLGLTFSISVSRNLRYTSCRHLPDRTEKHVKSCIAADIDTYRRRGFRTTEIHADGEYNTIQTSFPDIRFSICAVDDHVPEAERAIRSVKETVRATIHGMPYKRLPRVMVKELVAFANGAANTLPNLDGISNNMSPDTIVTGRGRPNYNTMKLEFGTYVQVYDGTSNDTKSRTLGAIALNPTGNSSGDFYFLSLTTGQRIHRRSWTVLPISDLVISRVEAIAFEENMPAVDQRNMISEYDPDDTVDDSAYDRDYTPPTADEPDSDHHLTTDAYTSEDEDDDEEEEDWDDEQGHKPDYDDEHGTAPTVTDGAAPPPAQAADTEDRTAGTVTAPHPAPAENTERENEERENEERATVEHEERTTQEPVRAENEERHATSPSVRAHSGPRQRYNERMSNLRRKRNPDYSYRYGFCQNGSTNDAPSARLQGTDWETVQDSINNMPAPPTPVETSATPTKAIQKAMFGLIFTQMSAHAGIKKHGKLAWDALKKEFEQFKQMDVLEPLDAMTITAEQRKESLRALSVIKEKRDGRIKGRTVADGSQQRDKYANVATGSPTVSNDALFLTIMINAFEKRDVATADIAGAYLHAYMKDFVCLRFTGWAVDLLCEVNPGYTRYTAKEGKTTVLYVRCNKAIYGCVMSGLLWYELFTSTLQELGFETNPYDYCVANATIEGSQCTVAWFVDDTMISHIKPSVVDFMISHLEQKFGKLSITRGRDHKFLGMDISFRPDGTASISMPSYIQEAVEIYGVDPSQKAPTPCAGSLFDVNPSSPRLDAKRSALFHSIVAKLIYVGTRARVDILLALSFLCGRVSAPTVQDSDKLKRLLVYLRDSIDLPLYIGADSLHHFMTWVDASFATHPDMRSHTGGAISFGRGGILCKSKKQTINTKSSTEAELVGASDYLPHALYVKMFMEAQGYPITEAIFYQDNESAIKMESNGKASTGQRSRHINIRYFFITDHSKNNDISIRHCPTAAMLADFFTKPLQGSLFRKFRAVILGHAHVNTLSVCPDLDPAEERVDGENPDSGTPEPNVTPSGSPSVTSTLPNYLPCQHPAPKGARAPYSAHNIEQKSLPYS